MNSMDEICNRQNMSADIHNTAVQIRHLLTVLETNWGEDAAKRALAIVTGDEK